MKIFLWVLLGSVIGFMLWELLYQRGEIARLQRQVVEIVAYLSSLD